MRARAATQPPMRARPITAAPAAGHTALSASSVQTRPTAPMHAVAAIPGLPQDIAAGTGPAIPGGVSALGAAASGLAVAPRSSLPTPPTPMLAVRSGPVTLRGAGLAQSSGPIASLGATADAAIDTDVDPTTPVSRLSSVDDRDADDAAATFPDGVAALSMAPARALDGPQGALAGGPRASLDVPRSSIAGSDAAAATAVAPQPVTVVPAAMVPAAMVPDAASVKVGRAGRRWTLVLLGGAAFAVVLIVGLALSRSKPAKVIDDKAAASPPAGAADPARASAAVSLDAGTVASPAPAGPTAKPPAKSGRAAAPAAADGARPSVPPPSISDAKSTSLDGKLPQGTAATGPNPSPNLVRPRTPAQPKPPADRPDI